MIDDSDVDVSLLVWLSSSGWWGVVTTIVLIIVLVCAMFDRSECAAMHCPEGQKPAIMHHECLCVTEARP